MIDTALLEKKVCKAIYCIIHIYNDHNSNHIDANH